MKIMLTVLLTTGFWFLLLEGLGYGGPRAMFRDFTRWVKSLRR